MYICGLNPRVTPPAKKTIHRILYAMDACIKDVILARITSVLRQMQNFELLSLEMHVDMWTARYTNIKYLWITIHYIGQVGGSPEGAFE